jgi:hypothetical protein
MRRDDRTKMELLNVMALPCEGDFRFWVPISAVVEVRQVFRVPISAAVGVRRVFPVPIRASVAIRRVFPVPIRATVAIRKVFWVPVRASVAIRMRYAPLPSSVSSVLVLLLNVVSTG